MKRKGSSCEVGMGQLMFESEDMAGQITLQSLEGQWPQAWESSSPVVPYVFLQLPLAGLNWAWLGKLLFWACSRGEPHSLPEDRWVGREESFRLGSSNKLPAGDPDKLSEKVQDVGYQLCCLGLGDP